LYYITCSDVNKDLDHKAKAKDSRYQGQGGGLGYWP